MTQRHKYIDNNEHGLDVYYDRVKGHYYVEVPYSFVGYGENSNSISNYHSILGDTERVGQMDLDSLSQPMGSCVVAIVDDYTDEQWELLIELIEGLIDYPVYDELHYLDLQDGMMLEFIQETLYYDYPDEEVLAGDVLNALLDNGNIPEEEENGTFYIHQDDFDAAVNAAKEV